MTKWVLVVRVDDPYGELVNSGGYHPRLQDVTDNLQELIDDDEDMESVTVEVTALMEET